MANAVGKQLEWGSKRYCYTNFFTIACVVWIRFFYDVSNVVNFYTIYFDVNISCKASIWGLGPTVMGFWPKES